MKGGVPDSDLHNVDAISGGTITSKGLEKMLKDCLINYEQYFKNKGKI
jgi:Na+-transporting NADH:ubiquinone oxidoreductase subunit C